MYANKDEAIDSYLSSLDIDGLNGILGKVLTELRSRENNQMQVDVITRSQRLRITMMQKPPALPVSHIKS